MAARKSTIKAVATKTDEVNKMGHTIGATVRKHGLVAADKAVVVAKTTASFSTGFWAGLMGR